MAAGGPAGSGEGVVQYSEKGVALGVGRITVINKGFHEKDTVTEKAKKDKQSQWKIIEIKEEGDVVLHEVVADGSVDADKSVTLDIDSFLRTYVPVHAKEFLTDYPKNDVSNKQDVIESEISAIVLLAIRAVMDKHGIPDVRFMTKPSKGVFAAKACNKGDYVAAPGAHFRCITVPKAKDNVKKGAVTVEVTGSDTATVVLLPEFPLNECASQFWGISTSDTHVKGRANCVINREVVKMRRPVLHGEKPEKNSIINISIPIIVNTKAIKSGEQLLIFREKADDKTKPEKRKGTVAVIEAPQKARKVE